MIFIPPYSTRKFEGMVNPIEARGCINYDSCQEWIPAFMYKQVQSRPICGKCMKKICRKNIVSCWNTNHKDCESRSLFCKTKFDENREPIVHHGDFKEVTFFDYDNSGELILTIKSRLSKLGKALFY